MMPRGLVIALQLLTRLPTPRLDTAESDDLARAQPFLPLVGLVVGVIVAAAAWAGAHVTPSVGALAGVVAWVWVTGAVHLDGLGDAADALGAAHRSPERLLAVLADPHAGSFAVVAIAVQIAAKLVLLAAIPMGSTSLAGLVALPLVPAWARWGALIWSRLPSLKAGLGRRFSEGVGGLTALAAWGLVLAAASLWLAPPLLAALPIVAAVAGYWRWRLGGVTGDCLGAGIEVTESLLLLALAIGAAMGHPISG